MKSLHGDFRSFFKDDQIKLFFTLTFILVGVMATWLIIISNQSLSISIRQSSFNIISILTGTGYSSTNFNLWGSFGLVILFIIMFIGGCAGSTTGVITTIYNKTIKDEAFMSVMGFFFLYIAFFSLSAAFLSFMGIDFLTAISASASAISNVGPGLGNIIGPSGSYAPLPDAAKWLLSIGMLLGRLELCTVMVLFTRAFWRA